MIFSNLQIKKLVLNLVVIMLLTAFFIIQLNYSWLQTISPAFLAAGFTQILNNYFTLNRERNSKKNEILKKFYYKIIPEIYDYFSIENDFKRLESSTIFIERIDTDRIKNNIISYISENSFFINQEIHKVYRRVKRNKYIDDLSGFGHRTDEISLIYTVIEQYINLLKELKDKDLRLAQEYACLYLIWKHTIFFNTVYGNGDTYPAMSMHFYFNTKKMNDKMILKLKRLDDIDDIEKRKRAFKKILEFLIEKSEEKNEIISSFFENMVEVNDSYSMEILLNLDIPSEGTFPIPFRQQYREEILSELYKSKYVNSKYDFHLQVDEYNKLHNEYKNALIYLNEKELVHIETNNEYVSITISAKGQDHFEKKEMSNY